MSVNQKGKVKYSWQIIERDRATLTGGLMAWLMAGALSLGKKRPINNPWFFLPVAAWCVLQFDPQ